MNKQEEKESKRRNKSLVRYEISPERKGNLKHGRNNKLVVIGKAQGL